MGIEKIRKKLLAGFFCQKKEQKEPKNLPRMKKINKIQKSSHVEKAKEERNTCSKSSMQLKNKGPIEQ